MAPGTASPVENSDSSTCATPDAELDSAESFAAEQAAALAAAQQAAVAARKAREAAARAAEAQAAADQAAREAKEAERAEALLRERTAAAAAAAFPALEDLRKKPQPEPHAGDARRRPPQAPVDLPSPAGQQRPAGTSTVSPAGADSAVPEWRRRPDVRPPVHLPAPAPVRPAWGGAAGHAGARGAAATTENSPVNGGAGCDGRAGKTDLRRIQAQQEGSEEARRALAALTDLGFPTKRAAAALLAAAGNVTEAEAALRAEFAEAHSLKLLVTGSFGVRSVAVTPAGFGASAWATPSANGGNGTWVSGGGDRDATDDSQNSAAGSWRSGGGGGSYSDVATGWDGAEGLTRQSVPWAAHQVLVEPPPPPLVRPTRLLLRKPGEKPPGLPPRTALLQPNPQAQMVSDPKAQLALNPQMVSSPQAQKFQPLATPGRAHGAAAGPAPGVTAECKCNGICSLLNSPERGGASAGGPAGGGEGMGAGGGGAVGGSGLSMKQKVEQVLVHLGMDVSLPLATAVKRANEAMGMEPEGPLPAQVDRLLAAARHARGAGARHLGDRG